MFCTNPACDFSFEWDDTEKLKKCPKCGNWSFTSQKQGESPAAKEGHRVQRLGRGRL